MKKKILIISWKSIDQSVIKKNFVDQLKFLNHIYIVNVSKILKFKFEEKNYFKFKKVKIYNVKNLLELNTKIKKLKPDLIIPYFMENYSENTKKIFYLLKQSKIPLLKILDVAAITGKRYFLLRLKDFLFKNKIYYDYLIHFSSRNSQNFYISKKNIYAHHYDYEDYLNNLSKKKNKQKKYALFLDENFASHPDLKRNERQNLHNINAKEYYQDMNKFFCFFSKNFNLEIKIAAHPTSNKNRFSKFKMVHDKTAKLVQNASIVLLHQSTSLSFPILFEKKILFLTSNEINKSYVSKQIFSLAKFFCNKPLNIDKDLNVQQIEKSIISYSTKYNNFKKFYLKHPKSLNRKFIHIFSQYFKDKNFFEKNEYGK